MDVLTFFTNNPMTIVLGLIGISLVTTSSLLGRWQKPTKQPVRIDWKHKK
jgi:hypothetical protein